MKETVGSLRAYFLIAGVLAVLGSLSALGDISKLGSLGAELPMSWKLALYFPTISRLCIGIAFVVAGTKLKAALPTGAGWIKQMIIVSTLAFIGSLVLVADVFGVELGRTPMIYAGVGVVISMYLYASVKRLAAEAQAEAGVPPPPPTAIVV